MADEYVPFESGFEASGVTPGAAQTVYFATDYVEQQKMQQFYPGETPWWQAAATQGLSRAIDAAFGPKAADKSTQPATYAGANGKTYALGAQGTILGLPPVMALVIGAGIVYALSSD